MVIKEGSATQVPSVLPTLGLKIAELSVSDVEAALEHEALQQVRGLDVDLERRDG